MPSPLHRGPGCRFHSRASCAGTPHPGRTPAESSCTASGRPASEAACSGAQWVSLGDGTPEWRPEHGRQCLSLRCNKAASERTSACSSPLPAGPCTHHKPRHQSAAVCRMPLILFTCTCTCNRQQGITGGPHLSAPISASNASRMASAMLVDAEQPRQVLVVSLLIRLQLILSATDEGQAKR